MAIDVDRVIADFDEAPRVWHRGAPATPATSGMIGSQEIASIRHGGTLINTARVALVDQAALIERLREGTMGAVPMRHPGTLDRLGGSA